MGNMKYALLMIIPLGLIIIGLHGLTTHFDILVSSEVHIGLKWSAALIAIGFLLAFFLSLFESKKSKPNDSL